MAEIIILANSRKLSHRCVAGISTRTGRWIRPVSDRPDRAITWRMREVDGKEPQLLDVLRIPLERTGPDEGCQPENRLLRDGKWRLRSKLQPSDVLRYCESGGHLFYNTGDCVAWDELQRLPSEARRSLQLIRCSRTIFYRTTSSRGKRQARVRFSYGRVEYDLVVTDLIAEEKVYEGTSIGSKCLLTISLAGKVSERYPYCYKLVAGVIEL